ncbi:folD [Symbiodinium sp. CCMP2592]|nr:folD [Symbiodinium sp. CCMP2592]
MPPLQAASVAETAMPLKCQGLDLSDWEDDDLPSLPSYSENSRSLDILAGVRQTTFPGVENCDDLLVLEC